jgi:hypothetical protein
MTYRTSFRTVVLAAVFLVSIGSIARSEIIEQVLVKVNGEIFTKTDLETRQVQDIRQRNKQIDLSTAQGKNAGCPWAGRLSRRCTAGTADARRPPIPVHTPATGPQWRHATRCHGPPPWARPRRCA